MGFLLTVLLVAGMEDVGGDTVFVSIPPQAYFVERILGSESADRDIESVDSATHSSYRVRPVSGWDVQVLVESGYSPETYEPAPKQLAELSRARIYFTIGVPFEGVWLDKISAAAPGLRIVDTTRSVPARAFHNRHSHRDPHIWLDPVLVKSQAEVIAQAFAEVDPGNAAAYKANLIAFQADLDRIHNRIEKILEGLKGRTILVYHPAWGYFADRYGLRQVAIEVEGKEPTARGLVDVISSEDFAWVTSQPPLFVSPAEKDTRTVQVAARMVGARLVTIDPLARDYLANLYRTAVAIRNELLPR